MDEALHHLFVLRDIRVQELQDEALVDDSVLDEQHGAERALADLLDELVAPFDHIARLEGRDIELLRRGRRFFRFLDDRIDVALVDEERPRGLGHLRRLDLRGDRRARVACVDFLDRADRGVLNRFIARRRAGALDIAANGIRALVVREPRKRVDHLDFDLFLGALEELHQRLDRARIAELAERAGDRRQRAGAARVQELHERRQRLLAADLRERIDGALAHPPILVLRRFDQEVDGALVLRLIQDLDRGATDIFVLVANELDDGVDDARAADAPERVGSARAHPPVVVFDDL